jgi:hypothetical protein
VDVEGETRSERFDNRNAPNESVLLRLPDGADAPGIRDGITQLAEWRLNKVTQLQSRATEAPSDE